MKFWPKIYFFEIQIRYAESNKPFLKIFSVVPDIFLVTYDKFQEGHLVYQLKFITQIMVPNICQLVTYVTALSFSDFHVLLLILPPNLISVEESFVDILRKPSADRLKCFQSESIPVADIINLSQIISLSNVIPIFLCDFVNIFRSSLNSVIFDFVNERIHKILSKSNHQVFPFQVNRFLNSIDFNGSALNFSALKIILSTLCSSFSQSRNLGNMMVAAAQPPQSDEHFLLYEKHKPVGRPHSKCPHVICTIANHKFQILVDTGSQITLMSQTFFNTLKATTGAKFPTLPATGITIRGVTGVRSQKANCQIYVDFILSEESFPFSVLVIPHLEIPFIMGIDFLEYYRSEISCINKCVTLLDGKVIVPWIPHEPSELSVNSIQFDSNQRKPVLRIFADSHGRQLSEILSPLLPEFDVRCSFKAGAKFNDVISELPSSCATLQDGDILVIIAGTNNVQPFKTKSDLKREFDLSLIKSINCPVIFSTVFQRFDKPELNKLINSINLSFLDSLKLPNIEILDSKLLFNAHCYNDSGVHLNSDGKLKLATEIAHKVCKIEDTCITSPRIQIDYEVNRVAWDEQPFVEACPTPNPWETLKKVSEPATSQKEAVRQQLFSPVLSDDQIMDKIVNVNIPPHIRAKLFRLLCEYRDIFSEFPGKCSKFTAFFKLKDKNAFVKRSYPVPFALKAGVKLLIQQLLDLKVIERSSSPYSNPIIIVEKKDGDLRLCLDARTLNLKLVSDAESPPNMESLLSKFSKPNCLSTLDFCQGFLQIELEEASRDPTSFQFEGKSYRFTRVPFGTSVSMQLFMRALDHVFGPETDDFLSRYVDHLRVSSENPELHLEHLRIIFQSIREAGLTLKFRKCFFFQEKIEFLDFVISKNGIEIHPDRTEAITNFPKPKNQNDLRSFLGFCNFYKRFAKDFSELAAPLFRLTSPSAAWKWTDEAQDAFDAIRLTFVDTMLLSYPDFNKEFFINTDS